MLFRTYGYLQLLFGLFSRQEKNEYSPRETSKKNYVYGEEMDDGIILK